MSEGQGDALGLAGRTVGTDAWRLVVPAAVSQSSPLLVVPTVHPRGDRRIVRCAQVALEAGFRVHFIWLGDGEASDDPAVSETILPSPRNAWERIGLVKAVARAARPLPADLWHIHDYYFLAAARHWQRKSGKAVLYDVHEYYASYYSEKLPIPSFSRRAVARVLEWYQVKTAKKLGGANVVTEKMAESFRAAGVPVSVSPNFPLLAQFRGLPAADFESRRWNVVHIGTLSREYGTELLVRLATRSAERSLPFTFHVIARYPSPDHQADFEQLLALASSPANVRLLPTRPTHEMPALLSEMGYGLSLLMPDGQNESAVPSKNYEYAMAGLVDVVTDRRAQRAFAESFAVGISGHGGDPDLMLDQMMRLADESTETGSRLKDRAEQAQREFTWELAVQPGLSKMFVTLASHTDG